MWGQMDAGRVPPAGGSRLVIACDGRSASTPLPHARISEDARASLLLAPQDEGARPHTRETKRILGRFPDHVEV